MNEGVRPYRMKARATAAADTHRRILEAAIRQSGERFYEELTLADVAAEAGVTVQTVLRRFGSKEGLTEAAAEYASKAVREARWSGGRPGDLGSVVAGLVRHYEEWGDRSLHFLAQEEQVPALRRVVMGGRELHHAWVEHAFGPWLDTREGSERAALRAQLIAVTDVYVWKILRRDLGHGAEDTGRLIRGMAAAILDQGGTT